MLYAATLEKYVGLNYPFYKHMLSHRYGVSMDEWMNEYQI